MARMQGKVAIITGGGGGIGRATAIRFAQEGARVAIFDIDADSGAESARVAEDAADAGGNARFFTVDVTDHESVAAGVSEVVAAFGKVDTLHNNAGGSTLDDGPVTEAPDEEFWRVMKLDLYGTFLCSKYTIPRIIEAGGGSVINMSSNVALMAVPGRDCYTAAKGGIAAMTRSMAVEYAPHRIRVNAIAPSVTLSERVKRLIEGSEEIRKQGERHLLGLAEPLDIAQMCVYLASDESRITTGQVLPVDSGITIT